MNTIARKLVLSVLTVVLSVIALGTTTFAWFTLTNTSVIQPFQAQVIADTGIEVAIGSTTADPLTLSWQTTITAQDIYDYVEVLYPTGFRFDHRTSVDGRNFKNLEAVDKTDGYLEIPLHFRSDGSTQINWTIVDLESTPKSFTTGVTFTDSSGQERIAGGTFTVNAADAFRVSVTGITDRNSETNPLNLPSTTVYENPALDTNTVLGGLTGADLTNGGVGVNGAVNYFYIVTSMLPTGAASVTTASTVTSISETLVLTLETGQELTAGANNYGYIVVRVWFEGWDAEAYNSLLSEIITLSLTFTD